MDSTISAAGHAAPHAIDDDRKVRLGMLFYVLTDVILVTFLFAAYVWLRAYNTNGGWFPYQGMALPDSTTSFVLVLLVVLSGVCFIVAQQGIRAGNQLLLRVGLVAALVLLVVTLVGQMRFMGQQQFGPLDGSFASTFIVVNGYHVYHLLFGLFLGLGLTVRAFAPAVTQDLDGGDHARSARRLAVSSHRHRRSPARRRALLARPELLAEPWAGAPRAVVARRRLCGGAFRTAPRARLAAGVAGG